MKPAHARRTCAGKLGRAAFTPQIARAHNARAVNHQRGNAIFRIVAESQHGSDDAPACQPYESLTGQSEQQCGGPNASGWIWAGPTMCAFAIPLLSFGGGNGGNIFGNGGNGGDGSGSNFPNELMMVADVDDEDEEEEGDDIEEEEAEIEEEEEAEEEDDEDDDDEEEEIDPKLQEKKGDFFVDAIRFEGLPTGEGIPSEDDLIAYMGLQPGFWGTKADLARDLRTINQLGLFKNVTANVKPLKGRGKTGKFVVVVKITEQKWPKVKSFKVPDSKLLPDDIRDGTRVMEAIPKDRAFTDLVVFAAIKNVVEGWYAKAGYPFSFINHFDGLETGNVKARVAEPVVDEVRIQFVDDNFQPVAKTGTTPTELIYRELPFVKGRAYSQNDARRALRDVFALNLFDNAQVQPEQSPKDPNKINVIVMLKERPPKIVDYDMEWALAPTTRGIPWLATYLPGGTLTFEDRNLNKRGDSISASITSSNLVMPADDFNFRVQYKKPYFFGHNDPKRTSFVVDAFNSRKISSAFMGHGEEVPPIYVDRTGAKIGLQETLSRNSKAYYGVVVQDLRTRDENGMLTNQATKLMPTGQLSTEGPPTTISESGIDRSVALQAMLARDTTYFCNGTPIGARDIVSVDQGIGLGSLHNRFNASLTRFIQLRPASSTTNVPPPVLVVNAAGGFTIGTCPSYDAFLLGGPNSVRAFGLGELAVARRYLAASTELRVPVPVIKQQAYAFAETATDLGSSAEVPGNPTEFFKRAGSGSAFGAGLKCGAARFEVTRDLNTGRREFWIRFGDRY